ncbi:MAG: YihY/virulence factor BrkB family protein [Acidobacteria bacterium]|nr:YihY/virulence factor BrkB family protein [Acidobacteriota bacterium]
MAESRLSPAEQISSLWSLGGLSLRELTRGVWRSIDDDNILGRAAELAFNFILALFPLLLFLLAFFGLFASHASTLKANLLKDAAQVLPAMAIEVISHTLDEVTANAGGGKLTFGIALTLWFASGGMSSMIFVLNGVYEVRETRSWFKVRAIAVALTVAISLLIICALAVVLGGGYLASVLGAYYGLREVTILGWRVMQTLVALAFVTFSFSLIYYFGPDVEEQHWYWITPGSVVGVLLWGVASLGFRAYLHFFNTYSKTYGSLGAVMILLMWLYITGLAFLSGGVINAHIEHAAARRGHPEAKAPGEKTA